MAETQAAGAKTAREYETIYVLRPDVSRDNAERIATRVEEVVARESGKLTQVETWGRRQLAYEVQRHKRGVYVYLKYLGGGALVNELERNLRMQDDVLKFQTVALRRDVDLGAVEVAPENVKFEAIEPATDEEDDQLSLERSLGLVAPLEGERRGSEEMSDEDGDMEGYGLDQEDE